MRDGNNNNTGCGIGCAYAVLSYPANWLFLRFVLIPYYAGTTMQMEERSRDFFMLLSPITLPMEALTFALALATDFARGVCQNIF